MTPSKLSLLQDLFGDNILKQHYLELFDQKTYDLFFLIIMWFCVYLSDFVTIKFWYAVMQFLLVWSTWKYYSMCEI